ncbi:MULTISPECIES: hypothetical protein [unclassified Halorubrum]|uniref:hypothetical protein n=1 Tax=unclassified Halorubrum TaxID=2642239 RepID=UPI003744A6F6
MPTADANPYLVAAATLAPGYDGIRRDLDPGPPTDDGDLLPQSPREALAAPEANDAMADLLGDLIRGYAASKRRELRSFGETVTEWERAQYVGTL